MEDYEALHYRSLTLGYTLTIERRWRTLNRKEQLRHRAISLRRHGFLVLNIAT